jgi:hypothetical protein
MADDLSLAFFVEQAKAMIGLIPEAGDKITMASEQRWSGGQLHGEVNYLGPVRMTWRLYFTKLTSSTILFVFHTREKARILLDATVSMLVRPLAGSEQLLPVFGVDKYLVSYPRCLIPNMVDADVSKFGPPGADRFNTFFFAGGDDEEDIVAVKDVQSKRPAVVFSSSGTPGPVQPQSKKYPIEPILAVLDTLSRAAEKGAVYGDPLFVVWPNPPLSPIARIVQSLIDASIAGAQSLSRPSGEPERPQWFQKDYRMAGCDASLAVRVAADGQIAESDEDEQFKSAVELRLSENAARMKLGMADFVLTGADKDSFFASFGVPQVGRELGKILSVDPSIAGMFLDSAKDSSHVVRVERNGGKESYLAYLRGLLAGQNLQLLLSGDFHVSDSFDPDTETLAGVVFNQATDLLADDGQTMRYFFKLIRNLANWKMVLSR